MPRVAAGDHVRWNGGALTWLRAKSRTATPQFRDLPSGRRQDNSS